MATAKQPGGLYYIGETAVDHEGKTVPGAPPRPPDTDPSLQPGALNAPSSDERIAAAIAKALHPSAGSEAPSATAGSGRRASSKSEKSED